MKNLNKLLLMIFIIALLIVGLSISPSLSTEASSYNVSTQEKLDQYIQEVVEKLGIPGMSIAISHKGDMIYSQSFGENIHKETRFYIGSTSKTFTALAVMQLVEQGMIDLDESVSTYLNDFTVSDKITVRHLLHHVSGMTEFDYISTLPPQSNFAELIQDMNPMSLTNEPGDQFSYFNPNYSLLGIIIERVSGQSYGEYIEEHILNPLELTRTSVHGEVDIPGHLSFFGFSIKRTEPHIQYDLPAGFISSTAEDVAHFFEAIRMKHPAVGVSEEGIEQMMTGQPFYGMGLINSEISGRPAVHHGGALPGYASNAIMLIEDEYSIAFLINKNHMLNGIIFYPDLTNGIVSILLDLEPTSNANYYLIFRVLIIFVVALVIYNIFKMKKLIYRPEQKTIHSRTNAAIVNFAIPIAVLILIPLLSEFLLNRGMTWKLAFFTMPDLLTWLFIGLSIHLFKASIHTGFIIKHFWSRIEKIEIN